MLKQSARKRMISFTITLKQFKKLCAQTGYMEHKGRYYDCLTVDRIIPELGYTIENVQVISRQENSDKYHLMEKDINWIEEFTPPPHSQDNDLPF